MGTELKTIHDRYSDAEIASFYADGYWERSSFFDVLAEQAQRRPDSVFLVDPTSELTYADFADRVLRLAAGLKRAGVAAGDRVVVQLPNWVEFPLLAAAVSRLGAIVVPIMPIYRRDEVRYVVQNSGATLAVTCGEFRGFDHGAMFRDIRADCPALRGVYLARDEGEYGLGSLIVEDDAAELAVDLGPDSSPDDGFLIVYTSGTTSRPKGCFHTFNTVRSSALMMARNLACTPSDVQFGPSPITHSTGLVTSIVMPLLVGARSYLMDVWEPVEALRVIEDQRCSIAVTATPFLQMLMGAYDPVANDASSLRAWVCAGSPIPRTVVEKARELFAGCQTLSLYGRSENFVTTMCTTADDPIRAVTSDGAPLDGAVVELVDAEGHEVAPGEEGDIAYRGPSHMIEYFGNDEETAALFTPAGLSRSGDLGRADSDGYIRVTGRLKDIVIRGGMNISARELEEHLLAHPGIANVAAVAMPDERLGEKVCVYVVPAERTETMTLADVTTFLREHGVAIQKLPERLEVVTALPMTATGKIQKHLLRDDVATKLAAADA